MARPMQSVENYTNTCLVMALVNLIWIFGVLWAVWGWFAVLVCAVGLNALITRLARHN
ncbi:hypothetical protein [Shimia litoralis]|uniref:hypothetical protein n=1 Tax=Shimia litoralis TaxID=420403 RepID=UPI0014856303|nr:hypothetical protein [Shimia litoralis]